MEKQLIDEIVLKYSEAVLQDGSKKFADELMQECEICSDYKELILKSNALLLKHSQVMSAKTISLVLQKLLGNHE